MTDCKVCTVIDTVDSRDSNAIIQAVELNEITNVDLASVLTKNNFPVSETSVRRHKNHSQESNVNR